MSETPQRDDFRVGDVVRLSHTRIRFEIRRMHVGGFGAVYVVRNTKTRRTQALKTFQARFLWRDVERERFLREALTWVMLDRHPHIAKAHFVDHVEGFPCVVMDYYPNGDLGRKLRRSGRMLPRRVLELAFQFCDGMQYAHDRLGLVHRDVKPENCLLSNSGSLMVSDFGLARSFGGSQAETISVDYGDTSRTRAIGTLCYMAPEQFRVGALLDTRTDLHAFGVMLYQMLTADLPRRGDRAQAHIVASGDLDQLPPDLSDVILDCVATDPADRPASFAQVRELLGETYEELTGQSPPPVAEPTPMTKGDWRDKGLALRGLERPEAALECYQRGLELAPDDVDLLSAQGVVFGELGRSDEELACYDRALEIDPDNALLWGNKASALWSVDRNEEALACSRRGLAIDAENESLWYQEGIALKRLGRHEEALDRLERARDLSPREAMYWKAVGKLLYENLGRREEALPLFDRGLEIAPRDVRLWHEKGCALLGLKRNEESLACTERALGIEPDNSRLWNNKGIALQRLGRFEEAITCYDRGLELAPCDTDQWRGRAYCLIELKRFEEVLDCCAAGLDADSTDADFHLKRGRALRSLGHREEAVEAYTEALRLDPDLSAALRGRGLLLRLMGRYDDAIADLTLAIELDGDNLNPLAQRGIARRENGDREGGLADLSDAIEAGLDEDWVYAARGCTLRLQKRYEEAVADSTRAIQRNAKSDFAWAQRGAARRWIGELDAAVADLTEALCLNPGYHWAHTMRGYILANLGRYREALADHLDVTRLRPKLPSGFNEAAWILATCPVDDIRDGARAVELATKACELAQRETSVNLDTLAAAQAEAGRFDEAAGTQYRAAELAPESKRPDFERRIELYRRRVPFRDES